MRVPIARPAKISARKTPSALRPQPFSLCDRFNPFVEGAPSSRGKLFRHALNGSLPLHRREYPLLNDFEVNKGNSECFVDGRGRAGKGGGGSSMLSKPGEFRVPPRFRFE